MNEMSQGTNMDVCIGMYVAAKGFKNLHHRHLKEIGITFTQFIVMMVLWKEKELMVKEIGKRLTLDSGTLTPVLKKLEEKGYIERRHSKKDARDLIISITRKGEDLRQIVAQKHREIYESMDIPQATLKRLSGLIRELIEVLQEAEAI